jgi:multidrug efflux pump subunit AcrA (membrane-fusion protein)
MKPGARVRSEIVIADLENAVTVPRQAVCNVDGASVVYRWTRGTFRAVEVELGPAGIGRVVVQSGLDVADVIALRDPTIDQGDLPEEQESSPKEIGSGAPGAPR